MNSGFFTERQFVGFGGFKQAIDSLRPGSGDIAMLTGYAGFRPAQPEYAVQRGVNVFMEKSFATDPPAVRRVIQDQRISKATIDWAAPKEEITSWQAQWNDFLNAIRHHQPMNQAKRAAWSNLADIMGRAAIHMGRIITWEEAMASTFEFCPNLDGLGYDTIPPLRSPPLATPEPMQKPSPTTGSSS